MHEAYIVYPPAKIPVQIESITSYDNNVILGTRQGHLLMYSIIPHPNENKVDLQLLQYDKNFSKKPISQIEVIPDYQLLFSLSDGIISVNDISRHNFPLVHVAPQTKGATVFALDVMRSKSMTGETALIVLLCVAVKRKLQFWYWKHDQLLEFAKDIELNDIPKVLMWSKNTICIGFKTEYILYDLSQQTPTLRKLFPTSSSRPIEPCISLLENNFFAVAKDEHLITVDPTNQEEKERDRISGNKSDTKKPANKSLTWSEPLLVMVWDEPFAVGLISDSLEIRVVDTVGLTKDTLIQKVPDLPKARFLIRGKRGLLFAASVTSLWCIESVDISKQSQSLLKEKNFHLALKLINILDESEEDKKGKILNIQMLYAYDLFVNKNFRESMDEFLKLKTDPCDVIRLFPDLLPQDTSKTPVNEVAAVKNLPKLIDKDLENGLLALIDYLTDTRHQIKKEMNPDKVYGKNTLPLLSIIDTTLLKCYLQTNDSFVAPLLRLNLCHLEEAEKTLKKYDKYEELIILYRTKQKHKRALELLQTQAHIPGSSLYGHSRTVQYLQNLGYEHKTLIFEFAGWILKDNPEEGLKIFTEDLPEVKGLPRAEVLDFLLKNHKILVIPYLEHIINVWQDSKALFHNILIQQYKEKITKYKNEIENNISGEQNKVLLETVKAKLLEFLKTSTDYHAEKILSDFPYNDLFEERAIILGRIGNHEKVLAIYVQILGDIPAAVEYCNKSYKTDDKKSQDVYITLIRTILSPPSSPPYSGVPLHPSCLVPNIEKVLEILEENATKIDPHIVLQILPDDISLDRLKTFLEIALHHHLELKRKTQILKGLYYAEHLQIQEQKMHFESRNFLVTEMTICSVCKKKFSPQSAFVRFPQGNIAHFSCQDKITASNIN